MQTFVMKTICLPFIIYTFCYSLSISRKFSNFFYLLTELRGLDLQTGYFTLRHIKAATGNFDLANKIGEGGFGPVYKVIMDY